MVVSTWRGESVTIETVFRCPRCGTRIYVEVIKLERNGDRIRIDRVVRGILGSS